MVYYEPSVSFCCHGHLCHIAINHQNLLHQNTNVFPLGWLFFIAVLSTPLQAPVVKYKSKKEVPVVAIFSNINTFIYRITAPQRLAKSHHNYYYNCNNVYP